jgi:hypothetical protein
MGVTIMHKQVKNFSRWAFEDGACVKVWEKREWGMEVSWNIAISASHPYFRINIP